MSSVKSINAKNVITKKNPVPCGDNDLKELCWEYSDVLPCCDAIRPRDKRFRDRNRILWGKTDFVDLFELKEELLKTNHFKFKAASWCMFPVLKKGDVLKVEPTCAKDIRLDDILVYRGGNKLYAHRVVNKEVMDGKQFIITRPDGSVYLGDIKKGKKISEGEVLGIIAEIKRGKKTLSMQRRKATSWDNFLYKKTIASIKLIALLRKNLRIILIKIQSLKFYQVFGKKLTSWMEKYLNFELVIPFSNEKLEQLYKYILLKDNKRVDFFRLKEAKIFHLVIKFNNIPIGCTSILNRPNNCPHKGFWKSDVYIRLRYRRLGFGSILLRETEEILKKVEVDNG